MHIQSSRAIARYHEGHFNEEQLQDFDVQRKKHMVSHSTSRPTTHGKHHTSLTRLLTTLPTLPTFRHDELVKGPTKRKPFCVSLFLLSVSHSLFFLSFPPQDFA